MTIKSIITATLIFALASAFAYRDSIAQAAGCNNFNGCWEGVTIPCGPGSGGISNCANVGAGNVPGGVKNCDDGAVPTYYLSTDPTSWTDCVTKDGQTLNCPRYSKVCMSVLFYKTKGDCSNGAPICSSKTIPACTNGSAPAAGRPVITGPACPAT